MLLMLIPSVSAAGEIEAVAGVVNTVVCKIFGIICAVAGGIAALIIAFAGAQWVMSREEAGVRKQALETMKHAIIGLIVILVASTIVTEVSMGTDPIFKSCTYGGATTSGGGGGGGGGTTTSIGISCTDPLTSGNGCFDACRAAKTHGAPNDYFGGKCCGGLGEGNCGGQGNPLSAGSGGCSGSKPVCCCTGTINKDPAIFSSDTAIQFPRVANVPDCHLACKSIPDYKGSDAEWTQYQSCKPHFTSGGGTCVRASTGDSKCTDAAASLVPDGHPDVRTPATGSFGPYPGSTTDRVDYQGTYWCCCET